MLLGAIAIVSCGGNKNSENSNDKDSLATATEAETVKRLDPNSVKPTDVLEAANAATQINCWNEKVIEIAGYPSFYYGDSIKIEYGRISLTDNKGGKNKKISITFKDSKKTGAFHKDDMIHLKGKVSGVFGEEISMYDCEVVTVAKTITTAPVDPFKNVVMSANDFYTDYFKWKDKVVTVKGNYWGTTTSTTSYGKTIRIDLSDANNNKIIGCTMVNDPGDKVVAGSVITVKGTVNVGGSFGMMGLDKCEIVN